MRFLHLGFKVNDVEKTSQAFRDLFGFDWEPVKEYTFDSRVGAHAGPTTSRVTHAWPGGVEIEMVETVEGVSTDTDLLGDREGISHIALAVDDLAAERARLEGLGLQIVSEGSAPRASWFFVKDERLGGALVQLVQLNEGYS